jgi:peptidoglycan/LPS O-acetylase OafA/YrhL
MQEIRPLTALRGVFACWVMLLHIFNTGLGDPAGTPWVIREGYLAVDFFFFLSGFILAGTYGVRMSTALSGPAYLQFVARRWGRLFPMHAAVILAIVLAHPVYSPMRVIEELTLTQRWVVWPPADNDWINMPSWSISTEWAASLLFPIFAWAGLRGSPLRSAITGAAAIFFLVYASANHEWNLNIWRSTVTILPLLRCFGDFALGVLAFRYRDAVGPLKSDWALLILGSVLLLALALEPNDLLIVAIMFPMVLGIAGNRGLAARALSVGPLHWLGTISYSIYLVHFPLILLLRSLWGGTTTAIGAVAYGATTAAATIAVAAATYRWIEIPGRGWVKRRSAALFRVDSKARETMTKSVL